MPKYCIRYKTYSTIYVEADSLDSAREQAYTVYNRNINNHEHGSIVQGYRILGVVGENDTLNPPFQFDFTWFDDV